MNLRRYVHLLVGLMLAMQAPTAGQVPEPAGDTVVLPTFEVPGAFPADGWLYARIGATEFLSQLSEKATRDYIEDFVIFQDFVRAEFPQHASPADQPVTVVLCKNSEIFTLYGGKSGRMAGSLPGSSRFILIDESRAENFTSETIIRLLRRRWLEIAGERNPEPRIYWLSLATRELLVALEVTKHALEFGLTPFAPRTEGAKIVIPSGTGGPRPPTVSHQFGLRYDGQPSLDRVFTLNSSVAGLDRYRAVMTGTAFSHLCQFSTRHKRWREPYKKFITRLRDEPYSEKLFQECFEQSTEKFGWVIRDYLFVANLKYESRRFKFPPNEPFELRDALPAEVLRMLRESQRLIAGADSQKSR